MKYGDFSTHCGKYLDLLMDIRNGKYMGDDGQLSKEFFDFVSELEKEMNEAFENSSLPEKPDHKKINALILRVNEMVVMGKMGMSE